MAKLFVIAGHGAGDPGACSGGYSEADLVRQLASRLKTLGGSAVQVGDTNVNWYASNYIGKGHCPKGVPVIELHMDSASASAKGGHVIIKSGFSADQYDNALANFIGGFFPGRSKTIVGRSDLANPNRAAAMGVNYRLVECGFISNAGDRSKFISQMDNLARGILNAFGISAGSSPSPSPAPSNGLGDDNYWGKKFTLELQKQLGTTQDGIISYQPTSNKKYLPNCETSSWQFTSNYDAGSNVIRALQRKIGVDDDGWCGKATVTALQNWLSARGFSVGSSGADGSMGPATCRAVAAALNAGAFK